MYTFFLKCDRLQVLAIKVPFPPTPMRDIFMRIVICDDDINICEQYAKELEIILEDNHLPLVNIEIYKSGTELLAQWDENSSDILFLDISMPEKDGIEVANELRAKGYQGVIIFLTVSNQYGIEAFDVDAFHYLVKENSDRAKIEQVFLKAYEEILLRERKYITLSRGGELRKIAVDSIYYFELQNRRMTVHYQESLPVNQVGNALGRSAKTEMFEFYSTIEKIEKALQDDGFVRVHQGYLVALRYVVQNADSKTIEMSNGECVPIGIRYANRVESALKERNTAC
jgi:Response regulator of the LytR/AlgR family